MGSMIGVHYGDLYKQEMLALTSGAFLYLAMSTLIPETLEDFSKRKKAGFFNLVGKLVAYAS